MKKIITAINNPKLNEELKKEKNFEIIGKDLLYKEAVLEILEKNNNIDIIILNENLIGEIKIEKLIEKIKYINEKIKIIILLEKENNNLEKILIKNKITEIYNNNKINLNELIKIINKQEINKEEEIIEEKNINYEKKEKVIEKKFNKKETQIKPIKRNMSTKVISFSGNSKSGKSTLALIISYYLSQKNNKVLLIDGDLKKQDLSLILKKHKEYKIKTYKRYKICFDNEYKKYQNLKRNIYYCKIKNELNFFTQKINNNLYFFNGLKHISENNKKIISIFFKIIKQNYNFIILDLSKDNLENINKNIIKNSSINFILLKPDLYAMQEIKKILTVYIEKWNINKKTLRIISNKKKIFSINKSLIEKNLPIKKEILEIKENKLYSIPIYQSLKIKNFLENKKIKNEINKIIKLISLDTK